MRCCSGFTSHIIIAILACNEVLDTSKHRSRCFGIMEGHDLFFERWIHCLISVTKVPDMRTYQNEQVAEFPAMSENSSIAN
jgi:hypothetical protein